MCKFVVGAVGFDVVDFAVDGLGAFALGFHADSF